MFAPKFQFEPMGDQPQAIEALTQGLQNGRRHQTLLGVTGSGKTYTAAQVIARVRKPTLVISHNKTLAAQLYSELKGFFPDNAVEYFVSYYDYYQPEAYIPQTDTYIEKDAAINDELERLRLSTTSALMSRQDVIVVASVSCIYNVGSREDFQELLLTLRLDEQITRYEILERLVAIQYERNDYEFSRGKFRVRGDTVEVFPAYAHNAYRIQLLGDVIEKISEIDPLSGKILQDKKIITIYPAKHFVTPYRKIETAIATIYQELEERLAELRAANKLLEAQRLESRTRFDMEMLREVGYCSGVENYSRHLSGRKPGERPGVLLDFFSQDYLMIIDESHATIPQIRGMYRGDRSRKETLVEHGFRLPSALDNRPLNFEEFQSLMPQTIFISATPGPYELGLGGKPVEQLIRPTGLIDPKVTLKPLKNQIDDLIAQIRRRVERKQRVLVTTLTKRMAEDLADYLREAGIRVKYLHSEIDAIERVEILRGLRSAQFDVLVGINLLREGLDLPEVSLVAILDADKEGFLRSETSLIQTAGRAARHIDGEVILYADQTTDSMKKLIDITNYRREKQTAYNSQHDITPRGIEKAIMESLSSETKAEELVESIVKEAGMDYDVSEIIYELSREMKEAADRMDFEAAARLRDQIAQLKLRRLASSPPRGAGRGKGEHAKFRSR